MSTELATAYITITGETSGIPRAVRSAFGQAEGIAQSSGRAMGSRMAGALGATLKTGAAAAAAAASVAMGVALKKGFDRLTAIDDAQGKLAGLGHSTQSTAKIMDSALASVKGTAFGLGDAATVAATAVAAGIKPGQDLTKYLKMVADASTIAGAGLGEIGPIMNGVQTSGVAMNDSLGQLADRGLPIFQWIGKEMNVTAGDVAELASKGEVSSEIFFRAIQNNIGGAALSSGKTVKGAFANMTAAMGRFGAALEGPTFSRLPGFFMSATTSIDNFTPKAKELATAFDAKVFDQWIPQAQKAFATFRESGQFSDIANTFKSVWSAGENLAPTVGRIASSLAQASAALGVSGWQVFLMTLQAAGETLRVVEPLLSGLANLMQNNQAVTVGLLAAFLAFRTIPALINRVSGTVAPLSSRLSSLMTTVRGAPGSISGFASGWRQTVRWMQSANPQLSSLRASMRLLGVAATTQVPTLGRMQTAYQQATSNASSFGRTQGVIRAGMVGARGAISGVAGALGGPFSAALIAAGVAYTVIASKNAKATQSAEAYRHAVKAITGAQNDLNVELLKTRGAVTDDVFSAQEKTLAAVQDKLDAATKSTGSFLDQFRGAGSDGSMWDAYIGGISEVGEKLTGGQLFDHSSKNDQLNQMGKEAKEVQASLSKLGYTNETLTKAVYGSDGAFEQLIATLKRPDGSWGNDQAKQLAADWTQRRIAFQQQQEAARRVVPGIAELGNAFQVMGDKSASASDKLNALKSAMDALNPARSKTEAMEQYGDAVRKAAESVSGINSTAFVNGQLDSVNESGKLLGQTLRDLAENAGQVAANGGDMAVVNRENEKQFAALAKAAGVPIEKIRELYGQMGGNVVDITVKLQGDTDVTQKLGLVQTALKQVPKGTPIELKADQVAGAEASLRALGLTVTTLPNGLVRIEANDAASAKLNSVIAAMSALPPGKAVSVSAPGGSEIVAMLTTMGVQVNKDNKKDIEVTSPLAPNVLTLLKSIGLEVQERNGKQVIVTADDTDYQTKKRLGKWSETEYKQVKVMVDEFNNRPSSINNGGNTIGGAGMGNADGSIRQYLDGGITALEAYANGGARLPNQALIQKPDPKGGLVQWAEPSTKGEAFIPLADGKRARSTSILATVAEMFGYQLVDKSAPDGMSGWVGTLAGSAIKGLTKKAGADGVTAYADGGIRTAAEFLQLAQGGFGASRSLQGAPYVRGGVNWGDCSGAMSAFARFAAGLDVFGGRFATASQAAALQAMGAIMGRGPAGTMRFGWYNGGPGGGHTAGTLPDGTNVEMGGGNGGGAIGGSVGADDQMFTDHAYLPAKASTTGAGGDGSGDYSGGDYTGDRSLDPDDSNGNSTTTASKDNSLSGRLGEVAKSFVSGQISSLFDVLSVNDQPGWLAAITEYENQQNSAGDGSGDGDNPKLSASQKLAIKQKYENEKLTRKQAYDSEINALEEKHRLKQITDADYENQKLAAKERWETADLKAEQEYKQKIGNPASYNSLSLKQDFARQKLAREQQYDRDKLALDNQLKNKQISQEAHDSQLATLKNKLDAENLKAQQEYEREKLNGKQTFDRASQRRKDENQSGDRKGGNGKRVRDPGTQKPGKDQDLPLPKLFDQGGVARGVGLMPKGIIEPERVLSPRQNNAFEEMVRRDFQGFTGSDQILAELRKIAELLARAPRGDNFDFRGDPDARRAQRVVNARNKAALAGL